MGSHQQVIEAIEARAREVREEAKLEIEKIEIRRERELGELEAARMVLSGLGAPPSRTDTHADTASHSESQARRRRKKKRASPSREAVAERRENVFRSISEATEPPSSGSIARELGYNQSAVRTALAQLLKEQRISRIGANSMIRYVARAKARIRTGVSSEPELAMLTVKDRGFASEEELAQAMHVPAERARAVCAGLQAEKRIQMSQRDGRPVYVLAAAA